MRRFIAFLRWLYDREVPQDATLWHPFSPFVPVRLIDGTWGAPGSVRIWRRRRDGRWEYRQDELSDDEQMDRQW